MKVIALKCPECGANLTIEKDRSQCFCQYCGTQILLDDERKIYEYRTIDEARIREAESWETVRLKELEIQEKDMESKSRVGCLKIVISMILGVLGIIFMVAGYAGGAASGDPDSGIYMLCFVGFFCMIAIVFIWTTNNDKNDDD